MEKGDYLDLKMFFDLLRGDGFSERKFHVREPVFINEDNIDWESASIINVTFLNTVEINNVDIRSGLAFYKCNFLKGIIFRGVSCNEFQSELSNENSSLFFSNCELKLLALVENCHFKRNIKVVQNSTVEKILLNRTKIDETGFKIFQSTITLAFDLNHFHGSVEIFKCIIEDSLRFENFRGEFSILYSNCKKWLKFWNVELRNLIFNHNLFEDNVEISASRIDHITISGDKFQKKFIYENFDDGRQILNCHLNELYISAANFNEGADIRGCGKNIDSIRLPITPDLQGILRIQNWHVAEIKISGINQNLKLLLCQMFIKTLSMIEFTNFADLTFERCQAENNLFKKQYSNDSGIIMAHNDLGKSKFIEVDFKSFDFLNIQNTSFNEAVFSNVDWFEDKSLVVSESSKNIEKGHRRRREIYRQLKNALKSQGNQIDSLLFQAREMKCYRAELKASNNYSLNERVIMLVNMSNTYGLNWLKPVCFLFLMNIMYFLICLPLFSSELWYKSDLPLASCEVVWDTICTKIEIFAYLFNPARRFTETYGYDTSKWLIFLDLMQRVILGIFIFQIIRGFRKFSNK